jgi:hypothetical protein
MQVLEEELVKVRKAWEASSGWMVVFEEEEECDRSMLMRPSEGEKRMRV